MTPVIFPVDKEHGALRFAVVILFIIALIIIYAVLNALITSSGLNLIAGIGAFVGAAIVTRFAETWLTKRWPSGRQLELSAQAIQLTNRGTTLISINPAANATLHFWHFKIKRRSRAPKGWSVVACAIEQDDTFLSVYTFAPPEQVQALNNKVRLPELQPSDAPAQSSDSPRAASLRSAGEQRRLLLAERHRWNSGAEMDVPDFERLIAYFDEHHPDWMPPKR